MTRLLLTLAVLGSLICMAYAAHYEHSIHLTESQLNDRIKTADEKPFFVVFYGKNCGFCKQSAPVWDRLAKVSGEFGFDVYHIDAHESHTSSSRFFVSGLPGMIFFKGDHFYVFPDRLVGDVDNLIDFALKDYTKVDAEFIDGRKKVSNYKGDVIDIDEDNWPVISRKNKWMLVEFYGPACGYCKEFTPTWEKVATEAKKQGIEAIVARINARDEISLAHRYDAYPWPSIILIEDANKYYKFPEPRTTRSNIQEYIDFITKDYKNPDVVTGIDNRQVVHRYRADEL